MRIKKTHKEKLEPTLTETLPKNLIHLELSWSLLKSIQDNLEPLTVWYPWKTSKAYSRKPEIPDETL